MTCIHTHGVDCIDECFPRLKLDRVFPTISIWLHSDWCCLWISEREINSNEVDQNYIFAAFTLHFQMECMVIVWQGTYSVVPIFEMKSEGNRIHKTGIKLKWYLNETSSGNKRTTSIAEHGNKSEITRTIYFFMVNFEICSPKCVIGNVNGFREPI